MKNFNYFRFDKNIEQEVLLIYHLINGIDPCFSALQGRLGCRRQCPRGSPGDSIPDRERSSWPPGLGVPGST